MTVARRWLGDLEVAALDVGTMHFRPSDNPVLLRCAPWSCDGICESNGRVVLGVNVVVARTPAATIVIDPCTFDDHALTAGDAVVTAGPRMEAGLQALGVDPDDVTYVLITHTHEDHFSGVLGDDDGLRFPNALHVLPEADWRSIVIPGHPFAASAAELRRRLTLSGAPGGALLVGGDHRVCDGVTLLPAPGETEGHQIVRLEGSRGRAYILGDLVHWPVELEDPRLMGPTSSSTEIRRRVIAETQEEPSTLLFTHGRFPGWGALTPCGQDRWQWHYA
jgi:glyoxylase-like metal-dependent hydrolase (beta-lactamase superfamily II)